MKASITIPTDLSEITLSDYQKFLTVSELYPDNHNFLAQKIIEIFCHVKPENVRLIKAVDVDSIVRKITKVLESKPKDLVENFKLNGVEYWFHPDLDDMSFGEYIDADSYLADIKEIHASMNVFYRPIKTKVGNKYTLQDYDPGKKDRLLNMPMDAVISSMEFFFLLSNQLSNVMATYFNDPKNQQALKEDSMLDGDGMDQFSYLLEKTLTKLKIQLP